MGFFKGLGKSFSYFAKGDFVKAVDEGISAGAKAAGKAYSKAKEGAEKMTKKAMSFSFEDAPEKISKAKDAFAKRVITDDESAKYIKNVKINTGTFGLADEINNNLRGIQSLGYVMTNGVGDHHIGRMIKRSDDSLFGYRANAFGVVAGVGAMSIYGTNNARKDYLESRKGQFAGTYKMGEIPGLTPQGHAYANNAGATGDLVLALNNMR